MKSPPILFQGSGFVAVDKPAGALVIPGRHRGAGRSLRETLEEQLKLKVFVVHRLDRDTSGVLLFALNATAHRSLSMAFESGEIEKHYLALVRGRLTSPLAIDLPLRPARRGRTRRAGGGEDGKPAVTRVTPVEAFEDATLVDAQPVTGRTHQIRVHLLEAGHPLLVDPQYGQPKVLFASALGGAPDDVLLGRTPLHASRLRLPALGGIEPCEMHSPLPADIAGALALLRTLKG